MKSKFLIFLTIFHIILITSPGWSQEFEMPSFVHAIDACDMDMDGSVDIIASCAYEDSIVILFNDGYGNFEPYYYGRTTGYLLCGCIDGDSIPDIVTTTDNLNFIKNNGDRTFADSSIILVEDVTFSLERIIDINKDKWNDFIYDQNTYWGIFKNNGNLSFSNVILESDGGPTKPSIGFLNNDSLPDILISYYSDSQGPVTKYLINMGNFDFTYNILNNIQYLSPIVSELNNIIPCDLTLFYTPTNEVHLFENIDNANFQFVSIYYINNTQDVNYKDKADYNLDGYDDFSFTQCLWTGCIDSLYVQLNDQNWSFMKAQQYYIGTLNWFRIKSIDLNEDSYPDFYMTGYNSNNKVKILWNNGDGTFSYLNPVGIYQPYCENKVIMQINPNPVHSRAIIQLNCVDISYISLKISDLQGFEVKSLMNNQPISKGINQITWDLTDNAGKRCCPGLYIITLTLNGKQFSQKLIFF